APVRHSSARTVPIAPIAPLTLAVAAVLAAHDATLPSDRPAATRAIDELTARLVDGRTRAALPRSADLGSVRAATAGIHDATPHTATIFGDPRVAATSAGSVTGAAVAFGATEAGKRGGLGSPSLSTSGSGGTASAVLSGLSELPVHAGFTVARDTTRTGTIHASIRPLERPG